VSKICPIWAAPAPAPAGACAAVARPGTELARRPVFEGSKLAIFPQLAFAVLGDDHYVTVLLDPLPYERVAVFQKYITVPSFGIIHPPPESRRLGLGLEFVFLWDLMIIRVQSPEYFELKSPE
jgi:hypothetical protein